MIRTKDVEMKEFLEVGMEVEDPMKRWCNAINIDSTNDDVTAYMKRVLTKSESRAFNQANELLGESSLHLPPIHPLTFDVTTERASHRRASRSI